jgi:LPS O-antigen subunit length determinant protein (WzzB/FepE family)
MTLNNSQPPVSPDNNHETGYIEDEIDIIDLIRPLWQQKIMIIAITFAIIAIAVILVLRATPQYKIYTQLKSGTYRWNKDGEPVPYLKSTDLKNLLGGGIFDTYTEQAGIQDNAPKINVASTRQGDQLTASIFWPDPEAGKKILSGYIDFLNKTDRNNSDTQTSGLQHQRNSIQKTIIKIHSDIANIELKQQTISLNIEQKKEALKLIDLKVDGIVKK